MLYQTFRCFIFFCSFSYFRSFLTLALPCLILACKFYRPTRYAQCFDSSPWRPKARRRRKIIMIVGPLEPVGLLLQGRRRTWRTDVFPFATAWREHMTEKSTSRFTAKWTLVHPCCPWRTIETLGFQSPFAAEMVQIEMILNSKPYVFYSIDSHSRSLSAQPRSPKR